MHTKSKRLTSTVPAGQKDGKEFRAWIKKIILRPALRLLKRKPACEKPNKPFRFMNLPAEIRLEIYSYALVDPWPIELCPVPDSPTVSGRALWVHTSGLRHTAVSRYAKEVVPRLRLLRVCKLVYNEASPVFYSKNEFRFSAKLGWHMLYAFLKTIGPRNVQLLHNIAVRAPFPSWGPEDGSRLVLSGIPEIDWPRVPLERKDEEFGEMMSRYGLSGFDLRVIEKEGDEDQVSEEGVIRQGAVGKEQGRGVVVKEVGVMQARLACFLGAILMLEEANSNGKGRLKGLKLVLPQPIRYEYRGSNWTALCLKSLEKCPTEWVIGKRYTPSVVDDDIARGVAEEVATVVGENLTRLVGEEMAWVTERYVAKHAVMVWRSVAWMHWMMNRVEKLRFTLVLLSVTEDPVRTKEIRAERGQDTVIEHLKRRGWKTEEWMQVLREERVSRPTRRSWPLNFWDERA